MGKARAKAKKHATAPIIYRLLTQKPLDAFPKAFDKTFLITFPILIIWMGIQ